MPRIEHTLDQPNREPGAACLGFRGRCSQSRYALLRRWRTAGLPNCNTHRARPIWPDEPLSRRLWHRDRQSSVWNAVCEARRVRRPFAYPNSLIGQTIYLKFASMNIVGGGLQSLASLPAYTYMVKGTGQASSIIVSGSFSGKPTANL